jgi:CRP-like cAMP-binding protein
MEEVLKFLHTVQPLSVELRDHISSVLQYTTFPKKAVLLKAGLVCRNIYFIRKGILRGYYFIEDTEISAWFMKEKDIAISIDSFYDQSPSYEYIQAIEETEVWYISYTELERIYRDFPDFNRTGRIITQHYHQRWVRQLFVIRRQSAEERYKWMMAHQPEILLRVPAKYIATYLDIAEITLYLLRGKL